jgi:hypothetical protein
MALKDLLSGTPSVSAIESRKTELAKKKADKEEERQKLTQHLANLEQDIRAAELEYYAEDSGTAKKRRDELATRLPKLRSQIDQLEQEIGSISEALSVLASRRVSAEQREVLAKFDSKLRALFAVGKDIDPIIVALSRKVAEGTVLAMELQNLSLSNARGMVGGGPSCNDGFRETVLAAMVVALEQSLPQIKAVGFDYARNGLRSSGGFPAYLESRMTAELRKLKHALTGVVDGSSPGIGADEEAAGA